MTRSSVIYFQTPINYLAMISFAVLPLITGVADAQTAKPAIIDFEDAGPDNTPISDQYWDSHGVRFSCISGKNKQSASTEILVAEQIGDYKGDKSNGFVGPGGIDQEAKSNKGGLGKFFLSTKTPLNQRGGYLKLTIEYRDGVNGASAEIWDIDGSPKGTEQFRVTAFNASDESIGSKLSPKGITYDSSSLDGRPWAWSFTGSIAKIEVEFIGTKTKGAGLAFDNFRHDSAGGEDGRANTYYVRTSGNDNNSGKSKDRAFRTIEKAASVVTPGDKVYFGAGAYGVSNNLLITRSGTNDKRILFLADTTGSQTGDAGTVYIRERDVRISADNLTLDGFHITGDSQRFDLVRWRGDNGELRNCVVESGDDAIAITGANMRITGCTIRNCGDDGVDIASGSLVTLQRTSIENSGDDGVDIEDGSAAVLIDCIVRGCKSDGVESADKEKLGTLVARRTAFLSNGGSGVAVDALNALLDSCLLYDNEDGLVVGNDKPKSSSPSTYLVGCTVADNKGNGLEVDGSRQSLYAYNTITAYNRGYGSILSSSSAVMTHYQCIAYANSRGNTSNVSTPRNAFSFLDPRFRGGNDFRLRRGSPAFNSGVNVYIPGVSYASGGVTELSFQGRVVELSATDIAGNPRVQGGKYDIGCFEGLVNGKTTYYVRVDGDDSRDGLSRSRAFRTIGRAASIVEPGDTVFVGGGTYRDTTVCNRAGSAGEPIYFIADADGSQTGDSGPVVLASQEHGQWTLEVRANYLNFEGFRFSGEEMTYSTTSDTATANYPYGAYVHVPGGEVTFENCDFTKLVHPLYSVYSGLRAIGCNFHDNISYSFIAYYGGVIVDNCDFTGTGNGPYSYRNHYTLIQNSRIKAVQGWSVLMHMEPYGNHQPFGTNTPTIQNCDIDGNNNGLYLIGADKKDRINFVNSPIKNLKSWEMYLVQCDLDLTPQWRSQWPIEKSGTSGLLTWHSKLDVSNMIFEGYTGQAFYSRYDDLTMKNCTSRNNGRGLDIYYPKGGTLSDIDVVDNTGWGLHVWVNDEYPAKLANCRIEGNQHGMYVSGATKQNFGLHNTTIANNRSYGLYAAHSDIELSPRTMGKRWRLSNNGYGLVTYYGKTLLEGITMSDNSAWAAVLHYGEATVRNCNFTGNGNGLYVYHNEKAEVTNCHIDDNVTHGLAVAANGTYYGYDAEGDEPGWKWLDTPHVAQIRNCTMDRNGYGLHMNRTLEGKIRIDNSPIRDNRSAGLYAANSEFNFNPTTMNRLFDMSGNQHFIYASYGRYTFEDLEVADMKGYGIRTWYSDVRLRNCDFYRNPSIAFYSYYDKSLEARNCKFQENGWGFYAYNNRTYYNNGYVHGGETGWQANDGPLRLVNCDISKNTHGVGLIYGVDDSLELVNTPIHDNTNYGLYTVHGNMTFNPTTMGKNWDLKDNGYHIVAGYGTYKFEDLDFTDAKIGGVSTHYGDVVVKNCKFSGNRSYGFQSYYNRALLIEDSQIVDNGYADENGNRQGTGMHLSHGKFYGNDPDDGGWAWRQTDTVAVIKNTPITNNGLYGLRLTWGRDDNIRVVNSPISGHRGPGLYASNCQFEFTPTTMGTKWQMFDNGSHIYASWGKYLFEDLTLTGAPSYGAATWGSDVTVRNCKFNENGSYGFHSHYDKLLVENSEFNNNQWAGITLRNTHPDPEIGGSITIRNSKIDGNGGYGIYAPYCRTDVNPITLTNTPISNNTNGVYFNQSGIEFKPGSFVMDWTLENNRNNNFVIRHGTTLVQNVTMSGAPGWMFNTAYGDVVMKNADISGNGNGVYLHANKRSIVENCKFNDNTVWGIWTRPYYGYDTTDTEGNTRRVEYTGPVKLTNVESLRNGNGLGVYDYTVTRDTVELTDVAIADNTSWGIQFTYLNGELNPDTFGQFDRALKQNGNGVYFNSCNTDLVGLTISGNSGWGGHSVYSNVTMNDCSFSGNGRGFYWYAGWHEPYMKDITLDVNKCRFDNNAAGQGLLTYWGKATVKNSTFNNNNDGFYTAYNVLATAENCEMKGNSRWGVVLHVNYADWSTSWLDDRKSWYQDNVQTLNDCVIDGNAHGLNVYNAKNENFAMSNVQITNNHYPDANGNPVGHGLYMRECRYTWDSQQTDNVVISGNGYGIGLYGSVQGEYTLKNARAKDCKRHGLIVSGSKARAENCQFTGSVYGLYWSRPKLVDVVNCRFEGDTQATGGWAAHGYGGPTANDPGVVKITNSIFNDFYNGLYTYVYGDEAYPPEIAVYNNTFANLSNAGVYANHNSSPVVRNNIFAHKPGSTSGYGLGRNTGANGNVIHSHNLLSGFSTPLASGLTDPNETTLVKEPRFADEANGDFRLGKGSPAINSGTDLSAYVPYDMEGNARPAYKVFEIGAYEFTDKAGSFRILDWNEKK